MKIEIRDRNTNAVMHAVEADSMRAALEDLCRRDAYLGGANLGGANLGGANLRGAYLGGAYLGDANLRGANLGDAYLRGAYLGGAYLGGAYLGGAYLGDANLRGAYLGDAYLRDAYLGGAYLGDANLGDANLRPIKHDLWGVLLQARPEVAAWREALIAGKVNGSTYSGECSCLCGTIGKARGVEGDSLPFASSNSTIELFVLNVKTGDTPETNQVSKLLLEWTDEFLSLIAR